MRATASTRTSRIRVEGPALNQPGPTRVTSAGPGLKTKTAQGLEGPIHLLTDLRTIWCRAFSPFSKGKAFLGRRPRLVWSRAFGPQSRRSGSTSHASGGAPEHDIAPMD